MNNPVRLALAVLVSVAAGACSNESPPEAVPTERPPWSAPEHLGWNQFLGAERDNRSPDRGLLKSWPEGGPPLAWKATGLGAGYATVAFAGDRIFTMGDLDDASQLLALDAQDGAIVWRAKVGKAGGKRKPGPRSTPATDGSVVVGLGFDGALVCVDAKDGKERWRCNLIEDFAGQQMGSWGYSEGPLLDGDVVVCTPGGPEGAVLALRKETGEVAWRCKELTDMASYASLIAEDIGGVHQYIALTDQSVAGIDAANGSLLWRAERIGKEAVCATPVYSDDLLFVTSEYKVGCNAFRITHENGAFHAEEIYAGKQLQNHHGGVVLVDGYVYGFGRRHLKCIELATGKLMWEDKSVGKGSITYADGHLIVRREEREGTLALVEATPKSYVENGRFDQPERQGEPSWPYPVVWGGRLYLRDQGLLLCYDLRAAD